MRIRLLTVSLAFVGFSFSGCDEKESDPKNASPTSLGADISTAGAFDPDGYPLVGVNGLGVAYSEFQDPATGDVFAGVTSTSTAGRLYALDDDDGIRWQLGFPAGITEPVVTPDGHILVSSGHFLIALRPDAEVAWRMASAGPVAVAPSGLIYQAATGALRAIAPDGTARMDLVGQAELPGQFFRDVPSIGPDGTLYFVTTDDPGGQPKSWLRAATPGGALLWSAPVADAAEGGHVEGAVLVGPDGMAWVNGSVRGQALLRGFDRAGEAVHVLPGRTLGAIDADGTLYGLASNAEGGSRLEAFDATGAPRWSTASSTDAFALLDDGGVMLFETVVGGAGAQYFAHRLDADGEQEKEVEVVVNHFTGSPLVRDDGFVFQPGFWANQNPPFEALATRFHLSGVSPATGAWSRASGDAGNTRAPWPVKPRVPALAELTGLWSRIDGDTVHVVRFGRTDVAYPDLAGVAFPFERWRYPVGALRPTAVARGAADVSGGHVVLKPTAGEGRGETSRLAIGESDPWSLSMGSLEAPEDPVEWRAAQALPSPESPLAGAGRPVWAMADSGAASTFAVDPTSGRVFVAGQYLSDADSRLGGNPLAEPPCCANRGTFQALLSADPSRYEWTDTAVDTEGGGSADAPLGAAFDRQGRPRVLTKPDRPRPTEPGVARLCATEIWSVDGQSHDVATLSIVHEGEDDLASIEVTAYALDAQDGEAIVGVLHGTTRFTGSLVLRARTPNTPFLMRYDAEGHLDIATALPVRHLERPVQAVFDVDGNLVLAGQSDEGVGLVVLDPQGEIRFEQSFASRANDVVALAVSKSGDIALGGTFDGTIDFGSEVMTVNDPPPKWLPGDAYVARFGRDGQLAWARQIDGPERQAVSAIAFDAVDNVVVAGVLGAPLGLDTVVSMPVLRAYDACGAELFTREATYCDACGAPAQFVGNLQPLGLAAAPDGDLVLMGWPNAWTELDGVLVGPPHPDKGSGTGGAFAIVRFTATPESARPSGACPEAWHDVTVTVPGKAGGRVVSEPPGIDCPGTCRLAFEGLAPVVLTAIAPEGGRFDGWSGACRGDGPCTLVTGVSKAVTARLGKPALDAVEVLAGLPERVLGAAPVGDDVILVLETLPGVRAEIGDLTIPQTPAAVVARVHGTEVRWAHLLESTASNGLTVTGASADPRGGIVLAAATSGMGDLRWDGLAVEGTSGAGPLALASVDVDGGLRFARLHEGLAAGPVHVGTDGGIAACRNAVFDADGAPLWVLPQGTFNAEHCLALPGGGSVFADTNALVAYDPAGAPTWTLSLGVNRVTALAPSGDGGFLLAGDAVGHPVTVDGAALDSFFLLWITAEGRVAASAPLVDQGVHGIQAAVGLSDGSALLAIDPTDAPVEWLGDWLVATTDELVLVDLGPDGAVRYATSATLRSEAGAGTLTAPGPFLVPGSDGRVLLAGSLGGSLGFGHDPTGPVPPFVSAPFYVTLRP